MSAPNPDLKPCGGCGVQPGERHDGCDVARCAATGEQWIQCGGELHEFKGNQYGEHEGTCQPDIWTGQWPGEAEAIEFGWYSYFDRGWHQCGPDHPGATPDLNRINAAYCTWSAPQQRWLKK